MADYKGIKGFKVQSLASDPSGPEGQIWYNTATYALKYQAQVGAWAAGGSMNTPRYTFMCSKAGTQTASRSYGGETSAPTSTSNNESYDGTSWSEEANMLVGKSEGGGAGTLTAALGFAGYRIESTSYLATTESWNGSSWSEVNNCNTARGEGGGTGTQTAALLYSGYGGSDEKKTENWNGTCWSEVADVLTYRNYVSSAGTSTGALMMGGAPITNKVESWNGTSWCEINDLNTARTNAAGFGATNTAAVFTGGNSPLLTPYYRDETETFDGTSWSEGADLATAVNHQSADGTSSAGINMGGINISPAVTGVTEEWTVANAVKTVTVS